MLCRCSRIGALGECSTAEVVHRLADALSSGLFSNGCFVTMIVLVPLADALSPRWFVASVVSLHYWLPMCYLQVLGSVGWGFEVEGLPPCVSYCSLVPMGFRW
jgi:hypothetical protein